MPTLERINVTPVKGMALLHPTEIEVTPTGIPDDRRFFLSDEADRMVAGTAYGPLVQIVARYDARTELLTMRFPDGAEVSGATDKLGAPSVHDFYGRPVSAHSVEGPWAVVLSAYVGTPVRLVRCDREGDGIDIRPLTMISRASIDDLAARGQHEGPLDSRRFRINLELAGCEPYEEDSWDGQEVAIGDARVRIQGAIPRCVVTTRDPETGTKDWNTLTQIARYRPRIEGDGGLPFGMYASVVESGRVRLGDAVTAS
jgi:uncharacterized protein